MMAEIRVHFLKKLLWFAAARSGNFWVWRVWYVNIGNAMFGRREINGWVPFHFVLESVRDGNSNG